MQTFNVGFISDEGLEDETQFDVESVAEIPELFNEFCKENGFNPEGLMYVERAEEVEE